MYNPTQLQAFMDKVNAEAEAAAQAVYDKYQAEFDRRVLAQMKPGDRLIIGNGTATFTGDNGSFLRGQKFVDFIKLVQFGRQNAMFEAKDYDKATGAKYLGPELE